MTFTKWLHKFITKHHRAMRNNKLKYLIMIYGSFAIIAYMWITGFSMMHDNSGFRMLGIIPAWIHWILFIDRGILR